MAGKEALLDTALLALAAALPLTFNVVLLLPTPLIVSVGGVGAVSGAGLPFSFTLVVGKARCMFGDGVENVLLLEEIWPLDAAVELATAEGTVLLSSLLALIFATAERVPSRVGGVLDVITLCK